MLASENMKTRRQYGQLADGEQGDDLLALTIDQLSLKVAPVLSQELTERGKDEKMMQSIDRSQHISSLLCF